MIVGGRTRRTLASVGLTCLALAAACATGDEVATPTGATGPAAGAGGDEGRGGGDGRGGDDGPSSSGKTSAQSSSGANGGDDPTSGGGGSGGAATTGATTATSSTGTGAACSFDADCFDGDPCTREACGPSGCSQAPIAAGQPATTEGAGCDGVCQTDGSCGLSLYERTFAAGQPFTRRALSEAWSGANAPPPRGIAAAERLYDRDVLFVFSEDGTTYVRNAGTWQAPTPTATAFPGIEATAIDCVMAWQPTAGGPSYMYFYTSGVARYAWSYAVDAANVATLAFGPFEQTASGLANEPPYGLADCDVSFMHQYAYADVNPWIDQWEGYGGNMWVFDGAQSTWVAQGLQATSSPWGGMPGGPAPGTTRDIYLDGSTLGFIAP